MRPNNEELLLKEAANFLKHNLQFNLQIYLTEANTNNP